MEIPSTDADSDVTRVLDLSDWGVKAGAVTTLAETEEKTLGMNIIISRVSKQE